MRAFVVWARMTVAAIAMVVVAPGAPVAHADDTVAINGTFVAFSDGQWAKTRERFQDEASVTQTWQINSTCQNFLECTGTVTSDQGWSAELRYQSKVWRVVRHLENWEPCADGTFAPGEQNYMFWIDPTIPTGYVGIDKTIGPSGACGVNNWLTVQLPLTLTRVV